MGTEGEFAVGLQRALEDVFKAHERSVEGLHKNNRRLLLEVQKSKAGVKALTEQLEMLYKQNQQLDSDKKLLESMRGRGNQNDKRRN